MLVAILFAGNAVATEQGPTPESSNSLEPYYGSWLIRAYSRAGDTTIFYFGKDTIKYNDDDAIGDYKMVRQNRHGIIVIERMPYKPGAAYTFLKMDAVSSGDEFTIKRECSSANIEKGSRGYALLQKNWDHLSPDQIQKLFKASSCFIRDENDDTTWHELWSWNNIERVKE